MNRAMEKERKKNRKKNWEEVVRRRKRKRKGSVLGVEAAVPREGLSPERRTGFSMTDTRSQRTGKVWKRRYVLCLNTARCLLRKNQTLIHILCSNSQSPLNQLNANPNFHWTNGGLSGKAQHAWVPALQCRSSSVCGLLFFVFAFVDWFFALIPNISTRQKK